MRLGTHLQRDLLAYDAENHVTSSRQRRQCDLRLRRRRQARQGHRGRRDDGLHRHVRKYYYAGAVRVAMRVGGNTSYLLNDHLTSTAITTNSSGARQTELRYFAYGGTRYDAGGQLTLYRYTGQRIETGTGLYDYGARWYDPLIGRFLAADSIVPNPGDSQSLNRYMYVLGNPLRYIDPTGHTTICGEACEAAYPWSPPRPGSGSPRPTPQPQPVPTPPQPAPTGTPVPSSSAAPQSAGSPATPVPVFDSFRFVFIDTMWRRFSGTRRGITSGMGVSFDLAAGAGATVAMGIYFDADGNVGIATREFGPMATTGGVAGLDARVQWTNAPSISELFGGWDVFVGGSVDVLAGVGADLVLGGKASSGSQIVGLEVNAGFPKVGASPLTVAELHVGASYSTQPLVQFNVYDLLEIPRPSDRNAFP